MNPQRPDQIARGERAALERQLEQAARRLEGKIRSARRLILLERLWPRLWLPLSVAGVFALLTALGLWQYLSPRWHVGLLTAFALMLITSLVPLFGLRLPSREEALRRLEQRSGIAHRPASAFEDRIATAPPATQATEMERGAWLWLLHRLRNAQKFAALRVGGFNAQMERYDPYALRAVLILGLLVAFLALGRQFPENISHAFNLKSVPVATADVRFDAWVNPPLYTGKPPVLLTDQSLHLAELARHPEAVEAIRARLEAAPQAAVGSAAGARPLSAGGALAVPVNSVLVLRLSGAARARFQIRLSQNGKPLPAAGNADGKAAKVTGRKPTSQDGGKDGADVVQERRHVLHKPTLVEVLDGERLLRAWQLNIIRDNKPAIALLRPPRATHRGVLKLDYRIADDYGVKSARAEFALLSAPDAGAGGKKGAKGAAAAARSREKPLVSAPDFALKLPRDGARRGNARSFKELASHPWAGLPVRMVLSVRDHAGQKGESEPVLFTLPQRRFREPVARAIINLRKALVMRPSHRHGVARATAELSDSEAVKRLEDLTVYLGLRTAVWRLRYHDDRASARDVVRLMWDLAVRVEDGDLSETERALRAAQERLMEALARKAPDAEIAKLMQELRQALARHLSNLARQQAAGGDLPPDLARQMRGAQTVTPEDFDQILKNIENLAKIGARDKAQQMLSQLRDMLEGLKAGRPGQAQGAGSARQMMKTIDGLGKMIMQQQKLLDQTFQLKKKNDRRLFQELDAMTRGARPLRQGARGRRGQGGRQGQGGRGSEGMQGRQEGRTGPAGGQRQAGGRDGGGRAGAQAWQENAGQGEGRGEGTGQREGPSLGSISNGQDGLRNDLAEMLGRLQQSGLQVPGGLRGSVRAMQRAGEALLDEELGAAIQQQSRALEGLRRGAQKLAEQVLEKLGGRIGQAGREGRDPAGRPHRGDGPSFGLNVKVPDEIVIQRAREILEELRRRLADPTRPNLELDYIERLIQRF